VGGAGVFVGLGVADSAGVLGSGVPVAALGMLVGGSSVGGAGVSVGGRGVSVGGSGVAVGKGVLVGVGLGVGVQVLVNRGRKVLVGVGASRDALSRPKLQPASAQASRIIVPDNNRVRLVIVG